VSAVLTLHPERVDDDPDSLLWVVPPGTVPFVGRVADTPGRLGDLVDEGTLTGLVCVERGVLATLACGQRWQRRGAEVRAALQEALAEPERWVPSTESPADLRAAVQRVLDGPAGAYVRSHGGRVDLVDIVGGVVHLRLSGRCTHCPAVGLTLTRVLEQRLRAEVPGVVAVRPAHRGAWSLGLLG